MINTRSTRSLSSSNARSKLSVSFSPKKVMSGYASHQGGRSVLAEIRWGGEEYLHNPRRVIRKFGFIFFALVIIPPTVLPLFLPRLGFFLRIFARIPIPRITNLAQRHLTGQYLLLDLGTDHVPMTLDARSGSERSVTLKNALHSCGGLERVDVLSVVLFTNFMNDANRERVILSKRHGIGPTRNSCKRTSVII